MLTSDYCKIICNHAKRRIIVILLFIMGTTFGYSQISPDSLKEQIDIHDGKINALDERVLLNESDLGKLNKIKLSGYIQAQFEDYQTDLVKTNEAFNSFYLRQTRIKFTYEVSDGIKFLLQSDFSTGNLKLKDAYAVVNLPKLKEFSLWAGQFNRPNYEVEYSSSQREVFERSRLIRTIYPGEREIGAKLEYKSSQIPLKVQLAVLNGNFTGTQAKDIDSHKDIMPRATYSIKLPSAGLGIDLGVHGYYGSLGAKQKYISSYENKPDSVNVGSQLDRQWAGAELQVYFDFLGGMSLKGEYIQGKNVFSGDSKTNPYRLRNFSGYYAYFIKNIGNKNQFVIKHDLFDPNSKLSGDDSESDVRYTTITLAWQYYLNEYIRISINYEMPENETNATVPNELKDNVFGVRIQAKF